VKISTIIPVLNEAGTIENTLCNLQAMRQRGHEVIVVDGGSMDGTLEMAAPLVDRTLQSKRGRAIQMHAGAINAGGDIFWFLHADTLVPDDADHSILTALDTRSRNHSYWGRFNVRLSGDKFLLRIIERLMNLRSRLTGIATGDQGLFVRRDIYERLGGFPEQPLMDDIEFSKRLKGIGRPVCLATELVTSSRRWEQRGVIRTILLMWILRTAYRTGVSARRLAYYYD
jgi:rSAM/selenodomain-associated transferase 2